MWTCIQQDGECKFANTLHLKWETKEETRCRNFVSKKTSFGNNTWLFLLSDILQLPCPWRYWVETRSYSSGWSKNDAVYNVTIMFAGVNRAAGTPAAAACFIHHIDTWHEKKISCKRDRPSGRGSHVIIPIMKKKFYFLCPTLFLSFPGIVVVRRGLIFWRLSFDKVFAHMNLYCFREEAVRTSTAASCRRRIGRQLADFQDKKAKPKISFEIFQSTDGRKTDLTLEVSINKK